MGRNYTFYDKGAYNDMKRLVIAEKPSVAMSIASVLGVKGRKDGYMEGADTIVSWCVGHLAA